MATTFKKQVILQMIIPRALPLEYEFANTWFTML